jgi:hypothetical protein
MKERMNKKINLNIRSSHTGSILSHLYRLILQDKGLLERYEDVISKYIIRNKNTGTKGKTEHNIKKDIMADTLSFDNFIYLIRETLRVKRFRITIELDYSDSGKDVEVHRTHFFSLCKFKKGEDNENCKTGETQRRRGKTDNPKGQEGK